MRELFDEMAGQSPLDPQEAVRRAARTPQRKRFYASAGVLIGLPSSVTENPPSASATPALA